MVPILLFARRWYEKYGKLPVEQDFINKIREFEGERDSIYEVIRGLDLEDIKRLKRSKSVREFLTQSSRFILID
jgi:hypothetical protein